MAQLISVKYFMNIGAVLAIRSFIVISSWKRSTSLPLPIWHVSSLVSLSLHSYATGDAALVAQESLTAMGLLLLCLQF